VIPRLDEKPLLHELRENRRAERRIEMPEPSCLRDSQLQSRHLEKLRLCPTKRD
jgi:hypothetical protein